MVDEGFTEQPADEERCVAPDESSDAGEFFAQTFVRDRARRMAGLYAAVAVLLLPWIVYLAITLPGRHFDRHYRAAWVGFDILLVIAISRTAYMAFRIDPRVQFPATATATLLFVDAWFDVTTAGSRASAGEAFLMALFIEIPAALFSLWLAHRVSRQVFELAHLEGFGHHTPAIRRRRRRRGSNHADSQGNQGDQKIDPGRSGGQRVDSEHDVAGELGQDVESA